MPCRINKRRLWSHRIVLESLKHEESIFVTLTYSDDNLPSGNSLEPRALQLFLKRLRLRCSPHKIRYFSVGEYGDQTQRPHYHLAIFGLGLWAADLIRDIWSLGHTLTGTLTLESANYIAGYVTKKMTKEDDIRLNGRHPEFARMSLKPGIGGGAIGEIGSFLLTEQGQKLIQSNGGDVPLFLQHGGRKLPLGRYLRNKLREFLQIENKGPSSPYIQSQLAEMQALYDAEGVFSKRAKLQHYQKTSRPQRRSLEARYKIYQSKKVKPL